MHMRDVWYHYPRYALRVIETPDGRLQKRLICRFTKSCEHFSPCDDFFANTQIFLLTTSVANTFALWYDKFHNLRFRGIENRKTKHLRE